MSTSISSRIHLPEPFPETLRIKRDQVLAWLEQVIESYDPERIMIFGSFANGQPGGTSDLDLLVVMPYEGYWVDKVIEIRRQFRPGFPLDMLVRNRQAVADVDESPDWILGVALKEGIEIYAR